MKNLQATLSQFGIAAFVMIALTGFSEKAQACQCVSNAAGFTTKVQWYRPGDFEGKKGKKGRLELTGRKKKPFSDKNITLGRRSCVKGSDNIAVLSVVGGKHADRFVKGASVTAATLGAAVGCTIATGGAAPQLCAGATNIALEASMAVALSLPGSAKLFAIKTPSTKRRLKVIGTVWQPALRKGKKNKKKCK